MSDSNNHTLDINSIINFFNEKILDAKETYYQFKKEGKFNEALQYADITLEFAILKSEIVDLFLGLEKL